MCEKSIIIYTSITGNTKEMADKIAEGMREAGAEPVMKDVLMADAEEVLQYDCVLLGSFTWGEGDLPDDFEDFYDDLCELDLTGKKAAAFGSCDSTYEHFGGAVDLLTKKLRELGADVVLDGLKVELRPSEKDKETCRAFGRAFVEKGSVPA
ncbi:MAG TPA: flavodoxin [Bacilli bacterium]